MAATNNVLDDFEQLIFNSMDIIKRRKKGLIFAVSRDSRNEAAAKGQTVRSPVVPEASVTEFVPSLLPTETPGQSFGFKDLVINREPLAKIPWDFEELRYMRENPNNGPGENTFLQGQVTQRIEAMLNEVESAIALEYVNAANGMIPSNTNGLFEEANYKDIARIRRTLTKQGAPADDLQLVLSDVTAERFFGNVVNTGGSETLTTSMLDSGVLRDIAGMNVRQSCFMPNVAPASGISGASIDTTSPYAVGTTSLTVNAAGTGIISAGDIIKLTAASGEDFRWYTVKTGVNVATGGTLVLEDPGIQVAIAGGASVDIKNNDLYPVRNLAFHRSAIHLVTRVPHAPPSADWDYTQGSRVVTDSETGLSFLMYIVPGIGRAEMHLRFLFGVSTINGKYMLQVTDKDI